MKLLIAGVALLGLSLGGCVVHGHGHGFLHGPLVVIPAAHVHFEGCGHYMYRGGWYHMEGHRHFGGCGHVFRGGVWVFED